MKHLVQIVNGTPRVSHDTIALSTDNKNKSIQDLITKNLSDFEEFGDIQVEVKKVKNSVGAINKQKTFWLNEQQATLLMTYPRNNEVVRKVKKALVKEFYLMRETISENINYNELYGRIGGLSTANQKYREQIEFLQSQTSYKQNCLLKNKPFARNSLLEFIASVQRQQQDLDICLCMMMDNYKITARMMDNFLDLYPEINPHSQSNGTAGNLININIH